LSGALPGQIDILFLSHYIFNVLANYDSFGLFEEIDVLEALYLTNQAPS